MNNCISVDWLTLHVRVPIRRYETVKSRYKIEKQRYQTRHFKAIFILYDEAGEEVCTLACEPHSEVLQFDSGLLKIHNKYLYQQDFLNFVRRLLSELQLTFRSVSRLDIAVDFQAFARRLHPQTFIANYMSGKYVKHGKTKGRVDFESHKGIVFETLKFGSETSEVSYYLYNKSKELRDKKMKPWIVDNWTANGWDGVTDVWRLEFSMKSNTQGTFEYDPETGETKSNFSFKEIEILEMLNEVYNFHFKKFMRFYYGKKKTRKDRMKPLPLFPERMKCEYVRIKLSDKKEASRADKIFAKKMMELHQEMRGHDFELSIFSNELLTYFILTRGIKVWAGNKIPGFSLSPKIEAAAQAQRNYVFTVLSSQGQSNEKHLHDLKQKQK